MKTVLNRIILIISGVLILNMYVLSQGKFEISIGRGLPEAYNMKARYGQNVQFGLNQGFGKSYSSEDGLSKSTSIEIYSHFGHSSRFYNQRNMYLMAGLNRYWDYYTSDYDYNAGSGFLFYFRIGRTINFSKRFGLTIDLGPMLLNKNIKEHLGLVSVIPSGNLGLFIRL